MIDGPIESVLDWRSQGASRETPRFEIVTLGASAVQVLESRFHRRRRPSIEPVQVSFDPAQDLRPVQHEHQLRDDEYQK